MVYLILIISLVGIVYGADLLVAGSSETARRFKVSDFVIGAAIVGIGTSMPELTVSVLGAIKGNADIAIGNVVGSNIFNILMVLGASAALHPVAVSMDSIYDLIILAVVSIISYIFARRKYEISRAEGGVMVAMYAAYIVYLFMR